jgi:hypothetical protein
MHPVTVSGLVHVVHSVLILWHELHIPFSKKYPEAHESAWVELVQATELLLLAEQSLH